MPINSVVKLDLSQFTKFSDLAKFAQLRKPTRGTVMGPEFAGVYLWGTKEVARRLFSRLTAMNIKVLGVFDSDSSLWGMEWESMRVSEPMPVSVPVILAAYEIQKLEEFALAAMPENKYFSVWDVLLSIWNLKEQSWNGLQHPDDLTLDILEKHRVIAERSETPEEYWRQVASRYFIGITSESNFPSHSREDEYFPEGVIETSGSSAFLDLGAFNGDTLEKFFSKEVSSPDFRIAVGVEPSKQNMAGLLETISRQNMNALAVNATVGESRGLVRFEEQVVGVESGVASTSAGELVAMIKVDDLFAEFTFTHVKMDIEGHERYALAGARNAISTGASAWSVCSYHLVDDFLELPKYFDQSYRLFCTSHAPRPWDTTFHFVK